MIRIITSLLLLIPGKALAHLAEVQGGYFSIRAKTSTASESISSFSALAFGYAHRINRYINTDFGYSVLSGSYAGSDLGYGINLGVKAYLYPDRDLNFENKVFSYFSYRVLRPYAGVGFYQRNFQSIKNSYAGLGYKIGTEYALSNDYGLIGEMRFISLSGSGESKLVETNALFGVYFKFD